MVMTTPKSTKSSHLAFGFKHGDRENLSRPPWLDILYHSLSDYLSKRTDGRFHSGIVYPTMGDQAKAAFANYANPHPLSGELCRYFGRAERDFLPKRKE